MVKQVLCNHLKLPHYFQLLISNILCYNQFTNQQQFYLIEIFQHLNIIYQRFLDQYHKPTVSVSLSYDPRFKKPFYSNRPFTFYLILLVILQLYLLMFTYRDDTEDDYLNLTFKVKGYEMPQSWLMFLLGMIILNSTLTHTYQIYGVPYVIIKMKNKL